MATFLSHGKNISIEPIYPAGNGPHPAVIVIHGSGGGHSSINQYSPLLAKFGYAVLVVRYFESTGTRFASPSTTRQHFLTWLQTLSDTVDYVAKLAQVDGARIGLLGISLGGYLALALASRDARIKAVVDIFGGFPEPFAGDATSLPPTLILHGESDPIVPVSEARKVETVMQRTNTPYEIKTYPELGHGFSGRYALDASQRILAFFSKWLKTAI